MGFRASRLQVFRVQGLGIAENLGGYRVEGVQNLPKLKASGPEALDGRANLPAAVAEYRVAVVHANLLNPPRNLFLELGPWVLGFSFDIDRSSIQV